MDRRGFARSLCSGALALSLPCFGQAQTSLPRVGFLISETVPSSTSRIESVRAGLRDYGYIEGKNIAIEIRSADGNYERLSGLAADLVALKVDVIVAFGTKAVTAAKNATTTIPIVDPVMGDPVATGLSSSFARPGGNITGTMQFSQEAGAKRLEYLKEAVPRVGRVAALFNPANANMSVQFQAIQAAAKALSLSVHVVEIHSGAELEQSFAKMAQDHIDAILVSSDTLFQSNAARIAELATKHKLPSSGARAFAIAGGMIGYSVNDSDMYRWAGYFIDKILKGAKPADLPIERATKLDLVINLKTAKALGLAIPQSLLLRADEVIQ